MHCESPRVFLLQGLELLVTALLARNRPTAAAGVPPGAFAAELLTLPSQLFQLVCEAIVKLEVLPWFSIVSFRQYYHY